ncbi:MAG: hypothetical protein N3A72_12490 [bacterium]|nr:hypothetical protein [bacterium]
MNVMRASAQNPSAGAQDISLEKVTTRGYADQSIVPDGTNARWWFILTQP